MRIKRVTRYYCDFCSTGKFTRSAGMRHESGCTANPNRICTLCERLSQPQPKLADMLKECGSVDSLMVSAGGCPACMLAAARAHNKMCGEEEGIWFDFKAEHQRYLSQVWALEGHALGERVEQARQGLMDAIAEKRV